jgi:hypothetical protein
LRTCQFTGVRPEHGDTGKDSVWELEAAELGETLAYREDPFQPGVHGFVEPGQRMTLVDYERALAATRGVAPMR